MIGVSMATLQNWGKAGGRTDRPARYCGLPRRTLKLLPKPWPLDQRGNIKLKVFVHEADQGGYWAEVPAIPVSTTGALSHGSAPRRRQRLGAIGLAAALALFVELLMQMQAFQDEFGCRGDEARLAINS